jgi:hypothetical protein
MSELAQPPVDHVIIVRNLLSLPTLLQFRQVFLDLAVRGLPVQTTEDPKYGIDRRSVVDHSEFEPLFQLFAEALSKVYRIPLIPTYSYASYYAQGSRLGEHTDQPRCLYTQSIQINASDDPTMWPIYLRVDDTVKEVRLNNGDGVIFPGIKYPHWRNNLRGLFSHNLFFHYVKS